MQALDCLTSRRSVPRLAEPAPDGEALDRLLTAAFAAPDHGQLHPTRLIIIAGDARRRLGQVFGAAELARNPDADAGAVEKTASKPLRAPLVIAVVCSPVPAERAWNGKHIPEWEQLAASAAAAQNLCLAAHAQGFGSMWRTGWYGDAPLVRDALRMTDGDIVVGWVYLGTVPPGYTPGPRRPVPVDDHVTVW